MVFVLFFGENCIQIIKNDYIKIEISKLQKDREDKFVGFENSNVNVSHICNSVFTEIVDKYFFLRFKGFYILKLKI